ncbi:hypothetical protein [Streptomyces sp. CBMA156]|uniref:hypothetical protein n=1 Tax=Streptomyces sp. CBMA156 TaxID=1930280 RepID=UPI0016619393|nr:hypothetical protein [Streptomyces sp. CBMA156]MBD0670035.1 hypothetical protein [Streptomyces sp. CBMA156]
MTTYQATAGPGKQSPPAPLDPAALRQLSRHASDVLSPAGLVQDTPPLAEAGAHLSIALMQLCRTEDSVGTRIASMMQSVEILALEYTGHGAIDVDQLGIIGGISQVLEHQSAMLATAQALEVQALKLRHAALVGRLLESADEQSARLARERVKSAEAVGETVETLWEGNH